jgi:predicted 3-demethylubiquinone-9 3-methyltransferase (glyoxalase superfamily)
MHKITPFLWFDDQAEEAVSFYTSVFKNSKIGDVRRYPEDTAGPAGKVMTISFHLDGQDFMALNGGPQYKFTEALSLFVNCETQEEIDRLWETLSEDGEKGPCGWLKDKYGVSWQIVPTILDKLMSDPDPDKASRVTQAMLKMGKLDISALQQAYDQE